MWRAARLAWSSTDDKSMMQVSGHLVGQSARPVFGCMRQHDHVLKFLANVMEKVNFIATVC